VIRKEKRMKRVSLLVGIALLAGLVFMSMASTRVETESLPGTWVNVDKNTGGLTTLAVTKDGANWKVRAWGSCQPSDCDWGEVPLSLVHQSVSSKEYTHAIAVWEPGFASTYVIIRFENEQLAVEIFTVFKDDSNRSDYRSLYLFQKE
jgi:hypothetical protein